MVGGKTDPSRGGGHDRRVAGRDGRDGPRDCAGVAPGPPAPTGDERQRGSAACSTHGRGRTPCRRRTGGCSVGNSSGVTAGPRRRSAQGELRLDSRPEPWHNNGDRLGLSELGAVTRVRLLPGPGPHPTSESAPTLSEPPSLASANVTLRPFRAGTRADDDTSAVAGRNLVYAATHHFGEPSSRDSRAAVSRRLQGRVCWSFSRGSSTTSPADPLRGSGPLGAREGAGDVAASRIERSARPLPVAGAGLDQAAQRLVCGATPCAIFDGHLIASQADRAVGVADGTGPAPSRTPHPAADQTGPQVLRAPVAAALSSPPPDPLPGLAAALRGLTHSSETYLNRPRVHFSADLSDR